MMNKPPKRPTPLPRGMLERKRGFYYRRRRGGRDELVFLHTDRSLAEIRYHERWLEDRTGFSTTPPPQAESPQPEPERERISVAAAAQRWLDSAVSARRKP